MGQGGSSAGGASGSGAAAGNGASAIASRSKLSALKTSGRYAVLDAPNGVQVHVVGVMPCSTLSEDEAADAVTALQPAALYIDAHPELLKQLEDDVAHKRYGRSYVPSDVAPTLKWTGGVVSSIKVRQLLSDDQMTALMAAETFGAYRAAIAAGINTVKPAPPRLVAFPMEMGYNNAEQIERPGHIMPLVVGNEQIMSTVVHAHIGSRYMLLCNRPPLIKFEAQLPPTVYFTRAQVAALQERNRNAVNREVRQLTAAAADVEKEGEELDVRYLEQGDAESSHHIRALLDQSMKQSQVVAHAIQEAAKAVPEGSNMVAVVNIGSMASLQRNWPEAHPYTEVFPPLSPLFVGASYAVQGTILGGVGYGLYRAGRRFPKTTIAGVVITGSLLATMAAGMIYHENMIYGGAVRAALARPRVSAAVARVNR